MCDSKQDDSPEGRFARALRYNLEQQSARSGKSADCVIVATDEMLYRVDAALQSLGISINAIVDEALPRRSIIFCNEADLDIWKIKPD